MEFSAAEWSAIYNSLRVGLCVVLASLPPGLFLGYALARHRFPGKWLVEVGVNLALVVPPVVTGYLLLQVFKPAAPVGGFLGRTLGLKVAFEFPGLVVAAAVMSFPLMVRAIRLGFQSVDPNLETAARTLGAGWWRTFFTVSLPLARNGVICRMCSGVRQEPGGVWGDRHAGQPERGQPDHPAVGLHLEGSARRAGLDLAAGSGFAASGPLARW